MDLTSYEIAKGILAEIDGLKSFSRMLSERKEFNIVMDCYKYKTSDFLFLLPMIDAKIEELNKEFKKL